MPLSAEILARKTAFETEQRRKRILAYSGNSFVMSAFVLFIAALSSSAFSGLLRELGLGYWVNPQTGVYSDCSRPENIKVSYCRPQIPEIEKTWKELTKSDGKVTPFSLFGD